MAFAADVDVELIHEAPASNAISDEFVAALCSFIPFCILYWCI